MALQRGVENQCVYGYLAPLAIRFEQHRDKAIECADRLAAEHPYRHRVLLYRAWARSHFADQLESAAGFVEQALEYHPECLWASYLGSDVYSRLNQSRKANACWENYRLNIRKWPERYKEPLSTTGVILSSKTYDDVIRLRLLASKTNETAELKEISKRLLDETEKEPKSIAEDYLHSLVRRSYGVENVKQLPTRVANRGDLWLIDSSLPNQADRHADDFEPLSGIPIVIDATEPASVIEQYSIRCAK